MRGWQAVVRVGGSSATMELSAVLRKHKLVTPVGPSDWKECGNALMAKKETSAAVSCYSAGLALGGDDGALTVLLLSNRAQAHLQLRSFALALLDADAALSVDPTHAKSRFRRGRALWELERFDEAAEAFRACGETERAAECDARTAQVRRGEYAWDALVRDVMRDSETLLNVSGFRHAALAVRELPGRGRGVVATEPLPAGTLVLLEKAAAVVFPTTVVSKGRKPPGELLVSALSEAMRDSGKLCDAVSTLSVGSASVERNGGPDHLRHVLLANAFAWNDSIKCNLRCRGYRRHVFVSR